MRWRREIAKAAGLPPLQFMDGFYGYRDITHNDAQSAVQALGFAEEHKWASEILQSFYFGCNFPIKWECLKPSPLHKLLDHSDCEGNIISSECAGIANALEELLPELPEESCGGHIGNWREKTQTFIDGLRLAAKLGEDVEFH